MTTEPDVILDASALLALMLREPGAEAVDDSLRGAVVSAVNWAEVQQVVLRKGGDLAGLRSELEERGLSFARFDANDADDVASLYLVTRELQISLADRACIALARRLGLPVLIGDRVWANLDVGVEIRLIR